MFYAALDVSLRSVAICIIDETGKVHLERSLPSEVPNLVRCLRDLGEPIHQVGLEAGTLTQHLTYGLAEAGFDVVCMEARQVNAALSAMRNKTDKNDARGIAQLLRSGWYSRVHVKSVESHYIRALLSSRKVMQRKCIDLENEIRALLKVFGVKLPMRLRGGAFETVVRDTIESDPALSHALLPLLEARQMLLETFLELDRRVRSAAKQDTVTARFMSSKTRPLDGQVKRIGAASVPESWTICAKRKTARDLGGVGFRVIAPEQGRQHRMKSNRGPQKDASGALHQREISQIARDRRAVDQHAEET